MFKNTKELVDSILLKAGEPTNGTSAFQTKALEYLNRVHNTILSGGVEFNVEVNDAWSWARAEDPIVLELEPKYDVGTINLTNGSLDGTFSSAPAGYSFAGWFLRVDNDGEVYKIIAHSTSSTSFKLDSPYIGSTASGLSYKIFKLDYDLVPDIFYIRSKQSVFNFEETSGTELTATITPTVYTSASLVSTITSALNLAGASNYTTSFDSVKKKFTISSDGAGGGGIFSLLFGTGSNASYNGLPSIIGFTDADKTGSLSYEAEFPVYRIAHLIEPLEIHSKNSPSSVINGIDAVRFKSEFPLNEVTEGYPDRFAIINQSPEGHYTLRFNRYPKEKSRVIAHYVPAPRDLEYTVASKPLIPREYTEILEFGAAAYILMEKEDTKWQVYSQFAGQKLKVMEKNHRRYIARYGKFFGEPIAREDLLLDRRRRKLIYGEPQG